MFMAKYSFQDICHICLLQGLNKIEESILCY